MTLFQPITSEQNLPQLGAVAEHYTLDIKLDVRPFDTFELAKDVAALANASGGVILVGAAEDRRRGTVGRYGPHTDADAKAIRDAYSQAVRDRCSPVPLIGPEIVPKDAGFVVAVNVWPFPGQAIGVLREAQPRTYAFPIRVGVDTRWMHAEQLPMLMVPDLRRVTILVDAIPIGAKVKVSGNTRAVTFEVLGVRQLENVLLLRVFGDVPNPAPAESADFNLPLDVIRSVWKDSTDGWQILVNGDVGLTGRGGAVFKQGNIDRT